MHLRNKVLQHLFRDLEIGDDTVFQGAYRLNVPGGSAEHTLGFFSDSLNRLLAIVHANRHYRGFIKNDAPVLDIDQRVSRAEVNRHIGRKHASKALEHYRSLTLRSLFSGLCVWKLRSLSDALRRDRKFSLKMPPKSLLMAANALGM